MHSGNMQRDRQGIDCKGTSSESTSSQWGINGGTAGVPPPPPRSLPSPGVSVPVRGSHSTLSSTCHTIYVSSLLMAYGGLAPCWAPSAIRLFFSPCPQFPAGAWPKPVLQDRQRKTQARSFRIRTLVSHSLSPHTPQNLPLVIKKLEYAPKV